MQTFLPYKCFKESAKVLDRLRLGKQRVEGMQLLGVLSKGPRELVWRVVNDSPVQIERNTPWFNHPAVKMWRGCELSLLEYVLAVATEWCSRGYQDTCAAKLLAMDSSKWGSATPDWLGDPQFHAAHRSNLLRKDTVWYSKFGWTEPNDLPYIWPAPAVIPVHMLEEAVDS